jgi:hypothetical protein
MIRLEKESIDLNLQNLNYIKITQTHIFEFECFKLAQFIDILDSLDSTHL